MTPRRKLDVHRPNAIREVAVPAPLRSGLRPRALPPGRSPASVLAEVSAVDALLEIGDLVHGRGALPEAFSKLVPIMQRVLPLEAVGVAFCHSDAQPSIRCFCVRQGEAEHGRVMAIMRAATSYFVYDGSLDRFDTLTATSRQRWLCLPITGEHGAPVGVFAVETVASFDERTIAFVVCVARHLASGLARDRAHAESGARDEERSAAADAALGEERDARTVAESKAASRTTIAELTGLVLSSFEYMDTLRDLSRVVGDRLATGCVIDIEGEDAVLHRIAHTPLHSPPSISKALGPLVAEVMLQNRPAVSRKGPLGGRSGLAATAERARKGLAVDWIACVPVAASGHTVGAITVVGSLARHAALPLEFIEELAHRIGVAVANARAYGNAVAAVRAREDTLATVSHDLKNPLSVILMNAAHILRATPSVERRSSGRHQVEAIERNARRMEHLVTDLLDFVSLEAGPMSLRPTSLDLLGILRETVDDAKSGAAARGVEVRAELPASAPPVWADARRTIQVLTNLLTNAVKFTGRGGAVTVGVSVPSKTEVAVAIADTGRGIAPDELPHVFERFWQAAASNRATGSGLGLAICKAIVKRSGGRIWVASTLGKGTIVTFTLPTVDDVSLSGPRAGR